MGLLRREFLKLTGAAALAGASHPATAQAAYPSKPLSIIVPFAAGGSTDVIARVIGQKVTEAWGQPVIIDTRPGGSTIIGTAMAAKADPDGYTLLMTVSNLVITEDGSAGPSNWGTLTTNSGSPSDSAAGAVVTVSATKYTDTISSLAPGASGVFTFKRAIN